MVSSAAFPGFTVLRGWSSGGLDLKPVSICIVTELVILQRFPTTLGQGQSRGNGPQDLPRPTCLRVHPHVWLLPSSLTAFKPPGLLPVLRLPRRPPPSGSLPRPSPGWVLPPPTQCHQEPLPHFLRVFIQVPPPSREVLA